MGLISAAAGAIGSTLHDQWKEFFYCDALSSDTIAVKAQKKTKGFLNRNEDNIIRWTVHDHCRTGTGRGNLCRTW